MDTAAPLPAAAQRINGASFLAPGSHTDGHVVLASYPRSGNSLMRALLEQATGIVTGSDTRPDRTLSRKLMEGGLVGEGTLDDTVWLVKTHWPERVGYVRYRAARVILLVRNPWDAVDSYWNMCLTNTHDASMAEEMYARLAPTWDRLLRSEAAMWRRFNEFWLSRPLPLLVVRYEDLVQRRAETLRRAVSFLVEGAGGSVAAPRGVRPRLHGGDAAALEAAIEAAAPQGRAPRPAAAEPAAAEPTAKPAAAEPAAAEAGACGLPYKPRSVGKVGKSFHHYSDAQFRAVQELAGEGMLRLLGYHPAEQGFPAALDAPPLALAELPPVGQRPPAATGDEFLGAALGGDFAPAAGTQPSLLVNSGKINLRRNADPFGRSMSQYRKALTRPIVRKDGVPLNVFEVEAALARKAATGSSFPENSLYELVPGAAAESALDFELRDAEQEAMALLAGATAGVGVGAADAERLGAAPPPPPAAPAAPAAAAAAPAGAPASSMSTHHDHHSTTSITNT